MSAFEIVMLVFIFLVTSLFGVVTGSNSLITVPVMFQLGMDEKAAVATNMFGLVFMAVGGAIPFVRSGTVKVRTLWPLMILTVAGSALGAAIVGLITNQSIKVIVTIAMVFIVAFTLLKRRPARVPVERLDGDVSPMTGKASAVGLVLTFLLAIYGGLYSGGYVTVLTAAFVAFFSMSYAESIASTKVINVFSSLVAAAVFLYQGLVNVPLGLLLGASMFVGAYVGAHYASKLNEEWLRRIFLFAVVLLAVKTVFDLVA